MSLAILRAAIEGRHPVQFEYVKDGSPAGLRTGNPHAIYIFRSINGVESTKVHIVQTAGVSKTSEKQPFPSFRGFDLDKIEDVVPQAEGAPFEISADYNPEWEGYKHVIAKV